MTRILAREVVAATAERFGLPPAALIGPSRLARDSTPRYLAARLIRDLCPYPARSYVRIGKLLGGRDHSTVSACIEKIDGQLRTDPDLRLAFIDLTRRLTADEAGLLDDEIAAAEASLAALKARRAALTLTPDHALQPGA